MSTPTKKLKTAVSKMIKVRKEDTSFIWKTFDKLFGSSPNKDQEYKEDHEFVIEWKSAPKIGE